jgi:hypothetical protein
MSLVRLPDIPSSELAPRVRLAQKLRAASAIKDKNDKAGELYEIVVGLRLAQFGWLRGGYGIGRDSIPTDVTDQKVYFGGKEVDALVRKPLDRRWLINEAKISGKAGFQIRYAIESTLVSQIEALKQGRTPELGGLVYAEEAKHIEGVLKQVSDSVIEILDTREFLPASRCTRDILEHSLELNCRKTGLPASVGKRKLQDYVDKYENFKVAEFYRTMLKDIGVLLGVTLETINPRLGDSKNGTNEDQLKVILAPELRMLEEAE